MQTILVIDDDECFHFLCEVAFKKSGENVTLLQAFDGVEALELLRDPTTTMPDVILLDINMPRMNGHEFLAAYAEIHPGVIPIVAMLTSSDQQRDRQDALKYDFVKDYLLKPLSVEDIPRLRVVFDDLQSTSVDETSAIRPYSLSNE